MPLPKPNRSQLALGVLAVAAVLIVGGVAWGFGQQVALARQMRAEEVRLEQAVAEAQAHHDELVARLEYVRSDEYVERWARAKMKMARPGEVAVVVLKRAGTDVAVDVQPTSTLEPEPQPLWLELWELVFGPTAP
jgi:cell division protein FtsB